MTCFNPIKAYRFLDDVDHLTGKWPVRLVPQHPDYRKHRPYEVLYLPCGRCLGCKLDRARDWSIRVYLESLDWSSDQQLFITLTYDDDHLPASGSLHPPDMTKFLKRLRKSNVLPLRYFQCGEYGAKSLRPHHHMILFGVELPDMRRYYSGSNLYESELLRQLWPFGEHRIAWVTPETIAYTTRYCTKKLAPDKLAYERIGCHPEYITMSRRPAIGYNWFINHYRDLYALDYMCLQNGIKCRIPRLFDKKFELMDPDGFKTIKQSRLKKTYENSLKSLTKSAKERYNNIIETLCELENYQLRLDLKDSARDILDAEMYKRLEARGKIVQAQHSLYTSRSTV